ncbi:hypothetical protein COY28_00030 [Candidatus Woesearchaeota archaeon CG_4_10_14_0_2_um_filter_57_5]|nr:MAG: hypothetical protein COY28_00030 [Candidatus Woesearchaeota archaeon CG_4_10_14_0_2_um_filter_57_5]
MGKGQVSIFVIAGILIVLLSSVAIFYARQSPQQQVLDPTRPDAIRAVVDSCHRDLLTQGIQWIGLHGGRILPVAPSLFLDRNVLKDVQGASIPEFALQNDFLAARYLYDNGIIYQQGVDPMEQDLQAFIDQRFDDCVNNFQDFRNIGMGIEQGDRQVTVSISPDSVTSEMALAITAKAADSVITIDASEMTVASKLGSIWEDMVKTLVEDMDKDPDFIPNQLMFEKAQELGVQAGAIPYTTNYVYYIIDDNEVPLTFIFAQGRP